jgi:hypothetical protein
MLLQKFIFGSVFLQQLGSPPGLKYSAFCRTDLAKILLSLTLPGGAKMPQEVSISYQAVKSKVYKLIDAMVEDEKTAIEVQESMQRWWGLIHPSDRAVAQKYLLMVLEKSNATLGAIILGLPSRDSKALRAIESERLPKLPARTDRAVFSQPI